MTVLDVISRVVLDDRAWLDSTFWFYHAELIGTRQESECTIDFSLLGT
jgi:hypothetical protein